MRRQTYGYLPSRRASPPLDRYQIILLGDRGACVRTTCPRLLFENGTADESRHTNRPCYSVCRNGASAAMRAKSQPNHGLTLPVSVSAPCTSVELIGQTSRNGRGARAAICRRRRRRRRGGFQPVDTSAADRRSIFIRRRISVRPASCEEGPKRARPSSAANPGLRRTDRRRR